MPLSPRWVLLLLAMGWEEDDRRSGRRCCEGLRVTGTFNTADFFLFVAKFGFQQTDVTDGESSQGFIFGNVTLSSSTDSGGKGEVAKLYS